MGKEQQMDMRIVSAGSAGKVYHRPECRYARKIYRRNREQMLWENAEAKGYRPCACCNGMEFLYGLERDSIENYKNLFHLDVDIKDHKIYVRTDAGCWKIIYKRDKQHFILLHRNYANGRTSLEDVEKVPYHRQGDMAEASTIMKYLKYIRAHDDFKQMMPKDYHKMPRSTKRQKAYYKAAKQREARKSARRVDNLFTMIERKETITFFVGEGRDKKECNYSCTCGTALVIRK